MRSRITRSAIALVLLGCFLCPVLEMFDRWDHTWKTGKDTESSVMILAVCLGAAISISFREAISALLSHCHGKGIFAPALVYSEFFPAVHAIPAVSQPPPPLRI